jgi:uncharacterized membrane protein YecN with MAPEG domain
MHLTTTTLYALLLLPIWLTLFMRISALRGSLGQSFGDGGDMPLLRRIRQHGNFIEWVPLVLFLMLLAEVQGLGIVWLHLAGMLLLLGRLVHPFGLIAGNAGHPLRYLGNGTNLLAIAVLATGLVLMLVGAGGLSGT